MTPRTPIPDETLREWFRLYAQAPTAQEGRFAAVCDEALARGERIAVLEQALKWVLSCDDCGDDDGHPDGYCETGVWCKARAALDAGGSE